MNRKCIGCSVVGTAAAAALFALASPACEEARGAADADGDILPEAGDDAGSEDVVGPEDGAPDDVAADADDDAADGDGDSADADADGGCTPDSWANIYGAADTNASFAAIEQTSDGGFIAVGQAGVSGDGRFGDAWILKLAADGAVEWQRSYGLDGGDWARHVRQLADGGYIVVGSIGRFGTEATEFWVLRLAAEGGVIWQAKYGDDGGTSSGSGVEEVRFVRPLDGGGFLLAGNSSAYGWDVWDWWLVEIGDAGGIVGQLWYPGGGNNGLTSGTDSGPLALAGTSTIGTELGGTGLRVQSGGGDLSYRISDPDYYVDISGNIAAATDGFLVAGTHNKTRFPDGSVLSGWAIKLTASGAPVWQKTYAVDPDWQTFVAPVPNPDGTALLIGNTTDPVNGRRVVWLVKVDSAGGVLWSRTLGLRADWATTDVNAARRTDDGGYVVAASVQDIDRGWVPGVIRIDAEGNVGAGCLPVTTEERVVTTADTDVTVEATFPTGPEATDATAAATDATPGTPTIAPDPCPCS